MLKKNAPTFLFMFLMLLLCPAACAAEEEISFEFPPYTPAPPPFISEYPLIDEVQVTSKLLVLSYRDKPDATWENLLYGEGGFAVPQLYQADFPYYVCDYDGEPRSVETSGCGVTCLSMALYYMQGKLAPGPVSLFREFCLSGAYVGNGIKQTDIAALAKAHGVETVRLGKTISNIRRALERGYPVIASMGEGYFGKGHYVVLRGLDENDLLSINDPNSKERSQRRYPLIPFFKQLTGAMPLLVFVPEGGSMEENAQVTPFFGVED